MGRASRRHADALPCDWLTSMDLRTMREAGAWCRVGGGDLSDEGFDRLLGAWIPATAGDRPRS